MGAGSGQPCDLVGVDVDAMSTEQTFVQQPGVREDLRRRLAGAGGDALDLDVALPEMGVDDGLASVRLGGDPREIRLGAGVCSVCGELHGDAAVLLAVPGVVRSDVSGEEIIPDRGVETPVARRDRAEVDVVQPQARVHAQAQFRELGQAGIEMHEVLADQRRAEAQRLDRAEPCQRRGFFGREIERIRDAFGVRGCEPEIGRDAAHHRERAVGVHVDQAGCDDVPGELERFRGRRHRVGGAAERRDPVALHREPAVAYDRGAGDERGAAQQKIVSSAHREWRDR